MDSPANLAPNVPQDVARRIHDALLKLHASFLCLTPPEQKSGDIKTIQDAATCIVRELQQAHIAITEEGRETIITRLAEWAMAHGWVATMRPSGIVISQPVQVYELIPIAEIYALVRRVLQAAIALEQAGIAPPYAAPAPEPSVGEPAAAKTTAIAPEPPPASELVTAGDIESLRENLFGTRENRRRITDKLGGVRQLAPFCGVHTRDLYTWIAKRCFPTAHPSPRISKIEGKIVERLAQKK